MATRRTSKGEIIDMDALISAAPVNRPVVGNMRVNAVGDVLNEQGAVIQKNEERVRAYYKDNPRSSTSSASLKKPQSQLIPDVEETPEPVQEAPVVEEVKVPEEFTEKDPIRFEEVELDNGDIQMVPVYEDDKDE